MMPAPNRLERGRNEALKRMWLVIALLRRGFISLSSLAHQADCDPRTIRRDLEILVSVGLPVEREHDEYGNDWGARWRLMPQTPCPICKRGVATGKEYREERRRAS